jgi:hypothetical protein
LSLHGAELRYSDPNWINRLRSGADLCFWGSTILLCGFGMNRVLAIDAAVDPRIAQTIIALGSVVYAIGARWFGQPDPEGVAEKTYERPRKLSWILLLCAVVTGLLLSIGEWMRPSLFLHWEFKIAWEIYCLTGLIGVVAQMRYLSKLASRMGATRICERARDLRIALAGALGLMIFTLIIGDFVSPTQWAIDNDLSGLLISLQLISGLTGTGVWILWMLLLNKIAGRLKEQYRLASSTWAAAGQLTG